MESDHDRTNAPRRRPHLALLASLNCLALALPLAAQGNGGPVSPSLRDVVPGTDPGSDTRQDRGPRRSLPRCLAGPVPKGEVGGGRRVPVVPNGPAPPSPSTRHRQVPAGVDETEWSLWWEFQQEPFLRLKSHVFGGTSAFVDDSAEGPEGRTVGTNERVPSDADLADVVLPALLQLLDEADSDQVVVGALVALARVGDELDVATTATVDAAIRRRLASSNQVVSETAIAALGILGHEGSAPLANALMVDGPDGRRALGSSSVPRRARAYAAYALGLIGAQSANEDVRRYAVHSLGEMAAAPDEATPDVAAASVLALGCVALPAAGERPPSDPSASNSRKRKEVYPAVSREGQLLFLLELLRDARRDSIVRCQVPSALGALLSDAPDAIAADVRREVATELLERVKARREAREVVQSAVAALAAVASTCEPELQARALRGLIRIEDDVVDRQARNLAVMALARAGAGVGDDELRAEVREHLQAEVRGGNAGAQWGALALAVFERAVAEAGGEPAASSHELLLEELRAAKSPLDVGAFAIACGLAGAEGAEDVLQAELATVHDDEARGYVAVALGMLGSRAASAPLRELLAESMRRPGLLRDAGIALALVGDAQAAPQLVAMLGEADTYAAQGAVAQALGRVGDRRALAPLVAFLEDDEHTPDARAFAAAALGIVADRDALPWDTRLSVIANYASAPPTLYEPGGAGLLNLL